MSETSHIITVEPEDAGQRLDKFLTSRLPDFSRNRLQGLIDDGSISESGKPVSTASAKIKAGQEYTILVPEAAPSHIIPQDMPIDIIYEDDHMLVINKPAGLTVHPAPGHPDMTLVNALLAHCGATLSGIGGVARPGIVHRIDKDTSGLLVVAKHDAAHAALSAQLADRSLGRSYSALVWGIPKLKNGTVNAPIGRSPINRQKQAVLKNGGGKDATTHYKTLDTFHDKFALVECNLETGRTHQIRVHMLHLGHPLVGDPVYGQTTESRLKGGGYKHISDEAHAALMAFERQALHARELHLIHPQTGEKMSFTCPLPADMQALISTLNE